jgi:hypothetical protein
MPKKDSGPVRCCVYLVWEEEERGEMEREMEAIRVDHIGIFRTFNGCSRRMFA